MTGPWQAPDSRPDGAPAPTTATRALPIDRPETKAVPTPIAVRPMTVVDVLDGAVMIIKSAPRTVFVIAATFVIPIELISAWVNRDSLSDRGIAGLVSNVTSSDSSDSGITGATILMLVLSGIVLALVTGAIARLVTSWYADAPASTRDVLVASVRRAPALIVAWVLVHVIELVSAFPTLLPALFLMPFFVVVSPAIVVEHLGPWKGVKRAWRLSRSRYGAVLGTAILIAIVDVLLTLALGGLGFVFDLLPFGWIGDVAIQAATSLVTVPFVAGAATLTYLDLRIRSEGLDLELDIAEHFASAG